MASSSEDKAQQILENEMARIESQRRERRKGILKVSGVVAAGLFVLSGLILSNAGHTSEWQMVDPPVGWTIAISAILGAISAFLILRRMKDGSFVFFLFVMPAMGAAIGIVGFGYVSGANAWFDDSPAEHHQVKVHERLQKRSSKSLVDRRRLVVDSWRTPGARDTIYVDPAVHEADPSIVIVTTHAGFFGHEWIRDVVVPLPRKRR